MNPITILIADDHWMVRDGIRQLLELNKEFNIIGEAADGEECIRVAKEKAPDVILLDISMPQCNGLTVLEELQKQGIESKSIVVTIYNDKFYVSKAIELGAKGYLLKGSSSIELKTAIIEVSRGNLFVDEKVIHYLQPKVVKRRLAHKESVLTERESQVLILLTHGLFNKEIGHKLGISEKTVKNHISNIFRKISVSDRTQAAIYAVKNNIVNIV